MSATAKAWQLLSQFRHWECVEQAGGWPFILARIANGEQVAEIARAFNVSRSFFARLLHEDRERHELVCQAREVAADALLQEEASIAALAGNATRDERQHAKLRADSLTWLAAKLNSQQYGDSAQAPVQIERASTEILCGD